MARVLLLLSALAIGGIAAVIYVDAENAESAQNDYARTALTPARPIHTADQAAAEILDQNVAQRATVSKKAVTTTPKTAITAKKIARWIADTEAEDPAVRATAIDALANAPKARALPTLLHLMRSGVDNDRQLAMDSLHTMALEQGDENDAIRTALRLVIYDGDDEATISSAQIALEDIEYDLPATTEHKKPKVKNR
jgi:hypothetical protein